MQNKLIEHFAKTNNKIIKHRKGYLSQMILRNKRVDMPFENLIVIVRRDLTGLHLPYTKPTLTSLLQNSLSTLIQ